jgi:16S rRNA C1402 (ribose-2'-O) methylase RsmI
VLALDAKVTKSKYVKVIKRKKKKKKEAESDISLEAKLLDHMVKNNVSLKIAVKQLAEKKVGSKSTLYQASLCIKDRLKMIT